MLLLMISYEKSATRTEGRAFAWSRPSKSTYRRNPKNRSHRREEVANLPQSNTSMNRSKRRKEVADLSFLRRSSRDQIGNLLTSFATIFGSGWNPTNARTAPNSDTPGTENCKPWLAVCPLSPVRTKRLSPAFQQPTLELQRRPSLRGQRQILLPSAQNISGISATRSYRTHSAPNRVLLSPKKSTNHSSLCSLCYLLFQHLFGSSRPFAVFDPSTINNQPSTFHADPALHC